MNVLNQEYFEEFKRLDKICKELYGDSMDNKLGVTLYLEDMDKKFYQGEQKIPKWNADYRQLKQLRNKRNELAHSQNSFSYEICTQEDVDFVRNFYFRILNQTDPIALLRQKSQAPKPVSSQPKSSPQPRPATTHTDTKKKNPFGCLGSVAMVAVLVGCVIAFLL